MKNILVSKLLIFLSCFFFGSVQGQESDIVKWDATPMEVSEQFVVSVNESQPFITVNPTWFGDKPYKGDVEYRINYYAGWSEWESLELEIHAPQRDDKFYFTPEFLPEETSAIQFRSNVSGELEFSLYYPGWTENQETLERNINHSSHRGGGCSCPPPPIQERLDWCPSGNCPEDPTPTPTTTTHIIVHHSAGVNTSNDWPAVVRSIWNYHVNTNGWDDVGYNYLIDPNGMVYKGRGNDLMGAHFSCMNPGTLGVCLLGNFENAQPTTAMLNALTELMGWKECQIGVSPTNESYHSSSDLILYNVSGHRDGNSSTSPNSCASGTVCPGENVYNLLPNLRSNTANFMTDCTLDEYSDIVVLDLFTNASDPELGETVELNAVLRNSGTAAISQPFNAELRLNGAVAHFETINSLGVNQSQTVTVNHTFTAIGDYNFCVYADAAHNELNSLNNSFCVDVVVSDTIVISGIDELYSSTIEIYPNPVNDILTITNSYSHSNSFSTLYDALGQMVGTFEGPSANVDYLKPGIYLVVNKEGRGRFVKI